MQKEMNAKRARKLSPGLARRLDKKGQGGIESIGSIAIGIAIALVIVAYVAPIGIEAVYGINFSTWHFDGESEDTKATGLMKLMPLFAVLGLVVAVVLVVQKSF